MSSRVFCYSRFFIPVLALPLLADSLGEGIKNFHQVDQQVYRGAQPSDQGLKYLAKLGVKTVIDLRESGARSREEEKVVTATGMKYINVPMGGLRAPTGSEMDKILGILENSAAGPVFVHCKRGADRTGAVIAAYRIDHDRWENARALNEAKSQGMSFFQLPRQGFILNFQPRVVEAKAPVQNVSAPVAGNAPAAQPVSP
jgi:protein tyrosine/serine phosphatase